MDPAVWSLEKIRPLQRRFLLPDRAVAERFSHYGGGQQSGESGAEAIVEQAQYLAIALRSALNLQIACMFGKIPQATNRPAKL